MTKVQAIQAGARRAIEKEGSRDELSFGPDPDEDAYRIRVARRLAGGEILLSIRLIHQRVIAKCEAAELYYAARDEVRRGLAALDRLEAGR